MVGAIAQLMITFTPESKDQTRSWKWLRVGSVGVKMGQQSPDNRPGTAALQQLSLRCVGKVTVALIGESGSHFWPKTLQLHKHLTWHL